MKRIASIPALLISACLCWAASQAAEATGESNPGRDREGAAAQTVQKEEPHKWSGVDETVVEKYAREAGRPSQESLINTERGDLPLFCFLVAGAIGGFIAGYYFRALFPPRRREKDGQAHV